MLFEDGANWVTKFAANELLNELKHRPGAQKRFLDKSDEEIIQEIVDMVVDAGATLVEEIFSKYFSISSLEQVSPQASSNQQSTSSQQLSSSQLSPQTAPRAEPTLKSIPNSESKPLPEPLPELLPEPLLQPLPQRSGLVWSGLVWSKDDPTFHLPSAFMIPCF